MTAGTVDAPEQVEAPPAPVFDPANYLIKLKGKDYLEVKWRLVWFRTDQPSGTIDTELVRLDENIAVFRASVSFWDEDGRQVSASGYGSETPGDFADYIEKAETKAIGRALGALGYGTQFADDHEMLNPDGTPHVVDAPVARGQNGRQTSAAPTNNTPRQPPAPRPAQTQSEGDAPACESCGDEIRASQKYSAQQRAGFIRRANDGKLICKKCGGG